jgi:uncharacterized protein YaiE (UPF0345 family)
VEGEYALIKHNKYFEGKVQSLGFYGAQGYGTVGVMEPGEYVFNTEVHEKMIIITGTMDVKIPGEEIIELKDGQHFEVEAKQSFKVIAKTDVVYVCYYG